jgi:hypothetical protein
MKRALILAATAAMLIAGAAGAQPRDDRYGDRDRDRGVERERPTLILFNGPDFSGRAFQTTNEITNLPKQDNDRAMSLRIQGRRAWQVCTNSDFKGRCQVFDHDVGDLRQFGLAGQISSMRPVR